MALEIMQNQIRSLSLKKNAGRTQVSVQYKLQSPSQLALDYAFATDASQFHGLCVEHQDPSLGDIQAIQEKIAPMTCEQGQVPPELKTAADEIVGQRKEWSVCVAKADTLTYPIWLKLDRRLSDFDYCLNNDKNCSGVFDSDKGSITLAKSCLQDAKKTKTLFLHEMLHAAGILDEQLVNCIVNQCPDSKAIEKCKSDIKGSDIVTKEGSVFTQIVATDQGTAVSEAAQKIAQNTTVQVPKQLATATLPKPQLADLKMTGESKSFSIPVHSQSFPAKVFRLAETAILPNKAFAASSTSPRTIASKTPFSSSSHSPPRSPASVSESPQTPTVSTESLNTMTQSDLPEESASSARNKSIGGSAVSGKVGSSARGSSPGSGVAAAGNNRRPPNTGSIAANEENLIQIIKTSSYQDVKRRLVDRQFIEALSQNGITIYDMRGQRLGSPTGKVIFSDTGNRFVQGK